MAYAICIPHRWRARRPAPTLTGYESRDAVLLALPSLLRRRSMRPAPEPFIYEISDNGNAFYVYRSEADSEADPTGARPLAIVTTQD